MSQIILDWKNYYIPIKATKMTQKLTPKEKTYEDVCVACGTPKREMLNYCPKCEGTTETVRKWLKEDSGSKDIWDYEQVSYAEAIRNLPRLDSWIVVEAHPKPKLTAKTKMTMAKKNTKIAELFDELQRSRSVLKCLYVAKSRGVVREAYILPSGIMMTTSPDVVVKEQYKDKIGVVSVIRDMVAEVKSEIEQVGVEAVAEAH